MLAYRHRVRLLAAVGKHRCSQVAPGESKPTSVQQVEKNKSYFDLQRTDRVRDERDRQRLQKRKGGKRAVLPVIKHRNDFTGTPACLNVIFGCQCI